MDEQLSDLLLIWEDDQLSSIEIEELSALLKNDPTARRAAVNHFLLSCTIREHLRESAHEESVVRHLQEIMPTDRQPPKRNRFIWGWVTATAIGVAFLFGAIAFYQFGVHEMLFDGFGEPVVVNREELRPEITAVFGNVQNADNRHPNEIRKGAILDLGQSVRTLRNSHATLRYPDGTTIELHSETQIKIESNRSAKHLTLQKGRLFADVAPQPKGAPLVINPGRFDCVEVKGTRFELFRKASTCVVRVEKGTVQFGTSEKAIQVSDRQESKVSSNRRPTLPESILPATIWRGWGRGLRGDYFKWAGFRRITFTRIDPRVDFHWGKGVPDPALNSSFAVLWTGEIEAPHSDAFVFYTVADWGVRLWVDGQMLIDNWASKGREVKSRSVRLLKGKRYSIKIEYWDRHGDATMRLLWSNNSMPKSIIDQQWLYPAVDAELAKRFKNKPNGNQ